MSAKVSVCIPVYGVEKYIEKCARSLFEQTMTDGLELIFVNDCTKDKSIEILEQLLSEYPHRKEQTKIIHREKNGGLVAARDTALAHASGEYIIHCDSDDYVESDMYEKMYDAAIKCDADIVCCNFIREFDNGSKEIVESGSFDSAEQLLYRIASRKIHSSLCTKMYKAHIALKDYSKYCLHNIVMCEDFLRSCCMLQHCKKIVCLPETYYHYRIRGSSISNSFNRKQLENVYLASVKLNEVMQTAEQQNALAAMKRWGLLAALATGQLTAKEWHSTWNEVKWGMLKDSSFTFQAKILFLLACVNHPLAAFIYRKAKKIS